MDGIGSVGMLAAAASQPFSVSQTPPAVADSAAAAGSSSSGGSTISPDAAAQYQMSVLSNVLYTSADQALSLIQMLPPPSSLLR